MGGVGKGHLIREIEAMGGLIGRLSDRAATHYRMLNSSKGYSAQGLRAILDRDIYQQAMLSEISAHPNIDIVEGRYILWDIALKTSSWTREKRK